MKNKVCIFVLLILIGIGVINYNAYSDDVDLNSTIGVDSSDDNLYLISDIKNFKNCIVNDKGEIAYISLYDDDINIIHDEYTKKPALIKVERIGERKITETTDYGDGDIYTYDTPSRRNLYYDKNGNLVDMQDDDINIDLVYNNYAIDNYLGAPESLLFNKGVKIFDLVSKQYVKDDIGFNGIVCENKNLFGKKLVLVDGVKKYKYFWLNDDLSVKKEIASDEYEDLNGKNYEDHRWTDNDIIFGIKHNLWYILNDKYELLSDGYDCEMIGMANFQGGYKPISSKYDYKDIIFYRIKDNKITYFTLQKDIYTKDINDEYDKYGNTSNSLYKNGDIYNRRYSMDETFVVGKNNCYAILDGENAHIYSLDNDTIVATISSIVDYRDNENFEMKYRNIFYLDDIYLYGPYVMCRYNDNISDSGIDYINSKNGFGVNILNKGAINMVKPLRFVKGNHDAQYQNIVDVDTQTGLKILYNKYIDMKVFESGDKYVIALQKDYTEDNEYLEIYDLYDKDYNLLYANVKNIKQETGLLAFERYKIQKPLKRDNDGKLYSEYRTIINFDNEILYECDINIKSGVIYNIRYTGLYDIIECVVASHYKEENGHRELEYKELFDSKKKKIIDVPNITDIEFHKDGGKTLLIAYTSKETYIYELVGEKFDLVKKLNEPYKYDYGWGFTTSEDGKDSTGFYRFINVENDLYSILDKDFNLIGEHYKSIEFGSGYYYYLNGFKIHICDFNNKEKAVINYFNSFEDE